MCRSTYKMRAVQILATHPCETPASTVTVAQSSVDLQCHATNSMLKISPVVCRQTENDLVSDAQRNAVLDCFCESRA